MTKHKKTETSAPHETPAAGLPTTAPETPDGIDAMRDDTVDLVNRPGIEAARETVDETLDDLGGLPIEADQLTLENSVGTSPVGPAAPRDQQREAQARASLPIERSAERLPDVPAGSLPPEERGRDPEPSLHTETDEQYRERVTGGRYRSFDDDGDRPEDDDVTRRTRSEVALSHAARDLHEMARQAHGRGDTAAGDHFDSAAKVLDDRLQQTSTDQVLVVDVEGLRVLIAALRSGLRSTTLNPDPPVYALLERIEAAFTRGRTLQAEQG